MKEDLVQALENYLAEQGFGTNWDGAYQDAISTIREFFDSHGFRTFKVSESDSKSRDTELIATNGCIVVRIPWTEDYNDRPIVDLHQIEVEWRAPSRCA